MPIFVVLGNWTDQGTKKVTEAPKRAKTAHDTFFSKVISTTKRKFPLDSEARVNRI